jgi:hypothetical protein
MANEQGVDYSAQYAGDPNSKLKDLEEKQRILKDRILLIGQNLIETKEKNDERFLEIKKDIEELKQKVDRISSFIETISGEFSKFAKKEDLEIVAKQVRLFQPFARKNQKT